MTWLDKVAIGFILGYGLVELIRIRILLTKTQPAQIKKADQLTATEVRKFLKEHDWMFQKKEVRYPLSKNEKSND